MKLFFINFLDELDHSKTSGSFLFFWPKNLKFSTQGTLPHLGCRDSRRREDLEANWLLLHLFIHQAKHIWAQTRRRSEQVWYIMCIFRLAALLLEKPHWLQLWDIFPPWYWSMCVLRSLVVLKEFLQCTHEKSLSLVCISIASFWSRGYCNVWSIRQHHQGITKDSRSKSKVEPFKKSESSIMIINFFALKLTIPGDDDDDDDVCDIVD